MSNLKLRVHHTLNEVVAVQCGETEILRYHYAPDVALRETPKPFIHPLRTPKGDLLSVDRPHDHVWHRGLFWGWAHVDEQNFWGGPTYVRDQGYVQLENNGSQVHAGWDELRLDESGCTMRQRLVWRTHTGEALIDERRTLLVHQPERDDALLLTMATELAPAQGVKRVVFGSPTTSGRPNAGYSGLTLRLAREMTGGSITLSSGVSGPEGMGTRAEWLHYSHRVDGSGEACGAAVFDSPENPRHPTTFFVRNQPFGIVCPAFCFDTEYELKAGKPLRLTYGVWLHSGAAETEHVKETYNTWLGLDKKEMKR